MREIPGFRCCCWRLLTVSVAVILAAVGLTPAGAAPAPAGEAADDARSAVPAAADRQKALGEVREIYKREYAAAKKPAERGTLAALLFENARETSDDLAARYALLEEALSLAIAAGRFNLAESVVDLRGQDFQVDALQSKTDLCLEFLKKPPSEATERKDFEASLLPLVDDAIEQDRFELAERIIAAAGTAGASARSAALRKGLADRQQAVKSLRPRSEAARHARQTLERDADNPVAHEELGRYLCFLRGKWDQGLPHLAEGKSKSLAELAQRSQTPPDDATQLAELADQWWNLAESLDAGEKTSVRDFAGAFYRQALPELKGLRAMAAKQRGGVAPAARQAKEGRPTKAAKTVNLIPLVDVAQDVLHGKWHVQDGKLYCDSGGFVPKVQIPYIPPEEYDYRIAFTQSKLRNPVFQGMPTPQGTGFYWQLGGPQGLAVFSHEVAPGKLEPAARVPGIVSPDQRCVCVVEVRRGGVRALVDGKQIAALATDFSDLKTDSWHTVKDPRLLIVGCDDPTVFDTVEVVEVRGRGQLLRGK